MKSPEHFVKIKLISRFLTSTIKTEKAITVLCCDLISKLFQYFAAILKSKRLSGSENLIKLTSTNLLYFNKSMA